MNTVLGLRVMAAAVLGATLAMSAYAGEGAKKGSEPAQINETEQSSKGKGGQATMPSRGPSSVDETSRKKGPGKGSTAAAPGDSKMASPRTPSTVSETGPGTGKGTGVRREAKKDKNKDESTAAK